MKSPLEFFLGKKVGGARVVPLVSKIITIFVILLLISNFASNYINLMWNRGALIKLMKELLVKDLKALTSYCNTQYDIYDTQQNLTASKESITLSAQKDLGREKSIAFAVDSEGKLFFSASKTIDFTDFEFQALYKNMMTRFENEKEEGFITFSTGSNSFFGVYKYNRKWDIFLVKAEDEEEFYFDSWMIFRNITFIILGVTLISTIVGIFLIRFILRFVHIFSDAIMKMHERQQIGQIDLQDAPNDDITYLGVSFNAMANTVENLMNIFKKFVARDVAMKAYKERVIRLEGQKKELAILFSDIKGFTYMTETLGNDIIKLLNIHYDRAIHYIHRNDGIIGSIIGDALLAVYGSIEHEVGNKSLKALLTAYRIQEVAAELRSAMHKRKENIVKKRGALNELEEKVYKAVLIEVGVGIDGGEVFYGNIGSYERMTNTVIGDNVNSSSRLEGLTRIYKVPVICSEYIRDDALTESDEFEFIEIDLVKVKGKTLGKRVFWPVQKENIDDAMQQDIDAFSAGLQCYYDGDWKTAYEHFSKCALPLAEVFVGRIKNAEPPLDWNGIWTMKTK